MKQRLASLSVLSLSMVLMSGCTYIHIGRIPKTDQQLASENADLRTEKKVLQQELSIVRKEGQTLRAALEAKSTSASDIQLAEKLTEATRELAQLRLSYAALRSEAAAKGSGSTADEDLKTKLSATEEKLALALHDYTELQKETTSLKDQLQSQKQENLVMAEKVQEMTAETKLARAAISQLNTELLAQKEARSQAQQAIEALRSQLSAVMKQERSGSEPQKLSDLRETTASSATAIESSGLRLPDPAASDAKPTAMLAVNRAKVGAAPETEKTAAETTAAAAEKASEARVHIVQDGDTLEMIARKYYGKPERWRWIYAANNQQLREGRPLRVGMQLTIPDGSVFGQ